MSEQKIKNHEKSKNIIYKGLYKRGYFLLLVILLYSFGVPSAIFVINWNNIFSEGELKHTIAYSSLLSIVAYLLTYKMIPVFMQMNYAKKIFGVDINKVEDIKNLSDPDRKEVPESLGIVPATVYIVVSIISQSILSVEVKRQLEFNSSLLSICFMVFLGFADDILDLRWRYKMILPTIASIPLLLAYSGSTSILVPKIIQPLTFGVSSVDLGIVFNIYMSLLAVFCTNSINIYAGINGLEVGQSLIIGLSMVCFNLIEIVYGNVEQNLFSLVIVLPFVLTSLALFMFNKYPADCFIGDTYCYFAGMTFACAGILGHYSKTLLLFFIPQILNFLLSVPQLIGIIPCPRHRLPKYNARDKLLYGKKENWNLLNVSLMIIGPCREQDICNYLLIFQVACSAFALFVRYQLTQLLY